MKTITEVLMEMIVNEKKVNELQDKSLGKLREEIKETQKNYQGWIDGLNHYQTQDEMIMKKLIKKVKKITLILSISIILNTISIIILNLWR